MITSTAKKIITQNSGKKSKSDFDRELALKCEKLIGARITAMQYPGGNSRDSVRLVLKRGAPVFASQRSRTAKADIERLILKTISSKGALVPKLLGTDGKRLLIQEDIPGHRLSQAMHRQSRSVIHHHLDNALDSLAQIHSVGSDNGLDLKLRKIGSSDEWLTGLFGRPDVLGKFLNIPAPKLDSRPLKELLAIRRPRFVKWDSRPGNAIVKNDQQVFWIDWEHCGTRNRLDDMVWLLGDEFIPHRPDVEKRLLETHLPVYADDLSIDEARQYFYTLGVFHLVIRMGLIYKYKKNGRWWNYDRCLAGDKAGVTRKNMLRICKRGRRWAQYSNHVQALSIWFKQIEQTLI